MEIVGAVGCHGEARQGLSVYLNEDCERNLQNKCLKRVGSGFFYHAAKIADRFPLSGSERSISEYDRCLNDF